MTTVTESLVRRVLAAVDVGFMPELGEPTPIRRLIHWLNGARWSSPQARARGLRRLAVAAIGSRGVVDWGEFSRRVARLAIQWCVPSALRAVAQCHEGVPRARLLQAAALCEREPTLYSALEARAAANDAAATYATVGDATDDATYYAALAAIWAAKSVADSADAIDAADRAVSVATYAADAAYAATEAVHGNDTKARAAYDAVLSEFAERVVGVLIDLRSPGTEYLVQNCDALHRTGVDVTA